MAKKYYAVKNGKDGVSGVYLTWEDCRTQVEGVSGVKYQGFSTLEQAEAFLRDEDDLKPAPKTKVKKAAGEEPAYPCEEGKAIAYVDGSYHAGTKEFSGGAVLFYEGEKVEFSQKNDDADMAEMHNVAGEIMGAVLVIRYCIAHRIPAVEIRHDYAGVGKWATGEWKTTRAGTKAYADFCRKAAAHIRLSFTQVQGHSGDYWNDEADRLAREALGIT